MYNPKAPFFRRSASSEMMELDRLIALLPAAALAVLLCGFRSVFLMLSAAAGGALAALLFSAVRGRPRFRLRPVAEGIVFAFVCPLSVPLWLAALGAVVAAAVAELFALFGRRCFFSPAAFAWLFFLALSPAVMTTFPTPSALRGMESFLTPSDFPVGESVLYELKTGDFAECVGGRPSARSCGRRLWRRVGSGGGHRLPLSCGSQIRRVGGTAQPGLFAVFGDAAVRLHCGAGAAALFNAAVGRFAPLCGGLHGRRRRCAEHPRFAHFLRLFLRFADFAAALSAV